MDKQKYFMQCMEQNSIQQIVAMNQVSGQFGLTLTEGEAGQLAKSRMECLKEQQRVEFGSTVLQKLIFAFCDSSYVDQENYASVLQRLQDIFYQYKNESLDELTDDELIAYMKEAFEGECCGSLEYLEETVLEQFAREIRARGTYAIERSYTIRGRKKADE